QAASTPMIEGFRQGLTEAGFNEGQNVAIEYRYADNQHERLPGLVAELIRLPVAIIVANVSAALVAKAATTTVPIVFGTGSDPVVDGLVTSINRPGGNVTGVSFVSGLLGAKRLEMLRQLVPAAATMAMLVGTDTLEARIERRDVELAAQALGQQLIIAPVSSEGELDGCGDSCVTSMLRPRTRRLISKMPCLGGSANVARRDWRPIFASSTSAWPRWLPPMLLSLSAMSC